MSLLSPRKLGPAQNHPDLADCTLPRSQHDIVILLSPTGLGPAQYDPDLADSQDHYTKHDYSQEFLCLHVLDIHLILLRKACTRVLVSLILLFEIKFILE